MNEVEKNMAVSALAQLLDQQPTAYAEVLAACRAMGWTASPTAQPADIIDELPSNVLPLIRRMLALLIYGDGSADSPAVVPVTERLYAQMLARQASPNYPAAGFPSDGVRPFLPDAPSIRDFAHLPQALSALADRKISGADVADGMSLVHLLCDTTAANAVTEICDDNTGWTMDKANSLYDLITRFPNATKFILCAKNYTVRQWPDTSITRDVEIWMYGLESILDGDNLPLIGGNNSSGITGGKLHLPDVKTMNQVSTARVMLNVSYLYLEGFEYGVYRIGGHAGYTNTRTQYIYLGCKGSKTSLIRAWNYDSNSVTTDIELRNGACQSVTLQNCSGLTAENMYNHILLHLKQDEPMCGDGVTITLGSTNIAKLEAVEEYNDKLTELEDTYGYTFA